MKVHPPSSGLLLVVNAAQTLHKRNIKVVGRSWDDGLKDGTISTVLINNTERALGSQHYSEAMQRKKCAGPCRMGGTKESIIQSG